MTLARLLPRTFRRAAPAILACALAACGGGGGGSPDATTPSGPSSGATPPPTYNLTVSVSGAPSGQYTTLRDTVNAATIPVLGSGTVVAESGLAANASYALSISGQPTGYACTLGANAAGTITAPTTVTVTCKATTPGSVETASTLITTTDGGTAVRPGNLVTLTGHAGWYDSKGSATTGAPITYQWTLGAGVPKDVTLLSSTSSSTQLYVPASIDALTFIPVTFTATSGGTSSSASLTVVADPYGPLHPTIDNPVQRLAAGTIGTLKVDPGAPSSSSLQTTYFKWTVADITPQPAAATTVILGADNTPTVGFLVPALASGTVITIRVAIGYAPITDANPGAYTVDAKIVLE